MTWIFNGGGPRWVELDVPKRRKSPRAVRFAGIKVGDQVMQTHTTKGWRGGIDDKSAPPTELSQTTWYYIATDLWFDPVAGQENHVAGEKVAIARIKPDGSVCPHKEPHTKRGLASQGFHYADRDYIAECKTVVAAVKEGSVVGIGMGRIIRQRPKLPTTRL